MHYFKTLGWWSIHLYLLPAYLWFFIEAFFSSSLIPIEPDGSRTYTLLQLSGTTMIWLLMVIPIGVIIFLGLMETLDRRERGYHILASLAFTVMVGCLASAIGDCLNFHLDSSRTHVHQARVQKSSVEKATGRRGMIRDSLFVTVLTPEGKVIKFKAVDNVDKNARPAFEVISFTFGRGFFGQAYVTGLELH